MWMLYIWTLRRKEILLPQVLNLFPSVLLQKSIQDAKGTQLDYCAAAIWPLCIQEMIAHHIPNTENDLLSHSKYTILGIFCGTVHRSRDGETYDCSCVSWINNSIIPEPWCGVIRASFSLISLHDLCLESFLFFLVPLYQIMQTTHRQIRWPWYYGEIR